MIPEYLQNQDDVVFIEVKADKADALKAERSIVHYISTDDVDRGKDVMVPKGMADSDFSKSPSVWYNHEYRYNDHALPIGKSLWRKKEEHGVLTKTQFATTEFADDAYTLHAGGFMNTWSIGFSPVKDKSGNIEKGSVIHDEGSGITTYNKWMLFEYSSAPIAMNPNARDMIKSLKEINFKSSYTKNLVAMTELEFKFNESILEIKEELSEIGELKLLLEEVIMRGDANEKSIIELTELLKVKKQKITKEINLPINQFSGDRITRAVRSIMETKK